VKSKIDKLRNRLDRLDGAGDDDDVIVFQVRRYLDRTHYRLGEKYIYHPGGRTEVINPENPEMIYREDGANEQQT
jgi:hypothetical protein